MPSYTVQNLITDLRRKVAPADPEDSRDLLGAIGQAASDITSKVKVKDLSCRAIIENALYDQVNRFKCPDDVDKNNIMQWFMLNGNTIVSTFNFPMRQVSNRNFDYSKNFDANLFTIEYQSGVKFIKVSDPSLMFKYGNSIGQTYSQTDGTGLTISTADSVSDNGIWNVSGNLNGLVTDNLTYISGSGSLRFNINTSSNVGSLFNDSLKPVDISEFLNVGKVFTWLDLPNLNQVQTVELRLGSSTSDYYSVIVNSPHDCDTFQTGQNLLGFILDRSTMTTVGLPDPTNISHVNIIFTTNGTLDMNDVRIDNIVARKGAVFGIQYISNSMFEDVNGLWKFAPTDLSDIIHLEYDAYSLLMDSAAVELGTELLNFGRKSEGLGKLTELKNAYIDDLASYKARNKEEFVEEQQFMYPTEVRFGGWYTGNSRSQGWNGALDNPLNLQ